MSRRAYKTYKSKMIEQYLIENCAKLAKKNEKNGKKI